MKLKGYLKGLCILGLSLLPIFCNAGLQEFDLGELESITANTSLGYNLRLTANANFLTNDLYKVVQFKGSGQYPSTRTYFWNGSGMYVLNSCVGGYSCNGSILGQGFIQYVNIVQYSTINMSNGVQPGFTPINDFISNSDYQSPDKLLLGGYDDLQSANLCFVYSNLDKAVCFAWNRANWNNCGGQPQYCTNGQLSYITNSQNLDTDNIASLASVATISPLTVITPPPSSSNGVSNVGINNAQSTYDSYRRLGYQDVMCYGGFDIDDIFGTGNSNFRGLDVGSGATIFQLYNMYSGGMEIGKRYDYYYFDYGFFDDYGYSESSPFIGKSKGLVGLYMVRDTYYKRDDFNTSLLIGFCGLSLTNTHIDRSKSPLDVISDTVNEQKLQDLIGDYGIVIPNSGSALDILVNALGENGFTGDLFSAFQSGYAEFLNISAVSDREGILPYYIGIGFLGILLLYLFRK